MNQVCSLKSKTLRRITDEMFNEVLNKNSKSQTILILDDYSAKILSSFLSMSQVINLGFYSVELLSKERKPYINYHACYFISPNEESANYVLKDFENEAKPKYRRVHLFFTHSLTDEVEDAYANEQLIRRIVTFKEANVSFHIKDLNMFHLNNEPSLQLFTLSKIQQEEWSKTIIEKLFTVCSIFEDYPDVIYQRNSNISMLVAKGLNDKLNHHYKGKQRKGLLLVVDRLLDPTTPFLHDYSWEALVYDLFPIDNSNELTFDKKKRILNETDEIWFKYKNDHMVKIFDKLPNDFDEFMKSDLSKYNKERDYETFDEMASAVKNIAEYKAKSELFSFHLKLAEEVSNVSKQYYP